MLGFDDLPHDISYPIITADPQTWRSMRLVSAYYHRLLSWSAYVNKFTVVKTYQYTDCFTDTVQTVRTWRLDGFKHREYDLPAMIDTCGGYSWFRHGKLHRDNDLPARVHHDGTRRWVQNGEDHRDHDRPSLIYPRGSREWNQRGKMHRDGNKPSYISAFDQTVTVSDTYAHVPRIN
jgi:hypothetical protein